MAREREGGVEIAGKYNPDLTLGKKKYEAKKEEENNSKSMGKNEKRTIEVKERGK